MALFSIDRVKICGFSACVPFRVVENLESSLFSSEQELKKYISTTGVERRHVAEPDICSSDLCYKAAEKLIEELGWDKSEIECLIFVSQTTDYIYPATSCILQDRLNLSTECICFDLSLSCPGWVYGLSAISSIVSAGRIKKALLLVGETVSKTRSPFDRVNLISGDAGTATALEYAENVHPLHFDLHTDGSGYKSVMIPDGGFRNPVTGESLKYEVGDDGIERNRLQTHMDGATIFSFAISKAPKSIKNLFEHFELDQQSIDYFVLHQANWMINERIIRKLGLDVLKCPNNMRVFGNTSSTAIPLTIVCQLGHRVQNKKIIATGFGGGLSWGSVYFELGRVVCPELLFL